MRFIDEQSFLITITEKLRYKASQFMDKKAVEGWRTAFAVAFRKESSSDQSWFWSHIQSTKRRKKIHRSNPLIYKKR
ncbi:hypothetical protein D5R40_03215 [Okeania hirsuta]|uniref:Uncharacterized protein n=1 Tax=Okeania hirsuta TaxID=1458930 RepID=A0A3N6Q1V0_9CYAN|nr:hypothetical protein D5R40_03215 [Okeania hirsuta]